MATAKKVKGTAVSIPIGVIQGVIASLSITCGISVVLTWLALGGKVDEKTIGYFVMGTLLISAVLGTLLSILRIQRRRMFVSCVTGGVYYLVLLGSTAVFFGGNYQGVGVTGLVVLIGCLISGILGQKANKHVPKRYKKYRTG